MSRNDRSANIALTVVLAAFALSLALSGTLGFIFG
jgi:hypothetical protein